MHHSWNQFSTIYLKKLFKVANDRNKNTGLKKQRMRQQRITCMPGYCGRALWDPKTEGFICVNGCLPANRKDKHLWTSETHEIIITDNVLALGSQRTQYSQLVIAVCFLIYCFISEPDFEAVHSAIIPAKWLPKVSEAPDYTHQSQESNSDSFFIRELRIWQLSFYFQSRNCACESTKTIKFLFFFLPFVHLQGNVEIKHSGWKAKRTSIVMLRQRVLSLRQGPSVKASARPPYWTLRPRGMSRDR